MTLRRDVRILLVGDEGVGKSTLESFVSNVQHIVPEITIPPEVTPENVTTYIVDTGATPQDRPYLESEIRKAHVICVVIPTFWLPWVRSLGVNVPVILVGNKIDLRGGMSLTNEQLEDEILPIMNEFKEVETCIEASAKLPLNVSEVFYFAQKAVLYPTAPLYDSRDHILKPSCTRALTRIFKLCDTNKDGILDEAELNEFQATELQGIIETVESSHPSAGPSGVGARREPPVIDGGLTLTGFLILHTLFIQKGRLETTWTVLRKFDVPSDCSVELSPYGYQFFTDIFEVFDKDNDGALSAEELSDVFSTSPGSPWSPLTSGSTEKSLGLTNTITIQDDNENITLQGWLAQWSMTTLLDHKTTLAYLAQTQTTALQLTPRSRRRSQVKRNVFLAYTSLLRAFAGREFRGGKGNYEPTKKMMCVVNGVQVGGREKYLILQEFGSTYEPETLRDKKKTDMADVIVYVHDSSDTNSFSYISNLRQQYSLDHIPTLFVATKSDLDLALQRHEVQPDVYCRRLGLQVPVAVSTKTGQLADVFQNIVEIAMNPSSAIPGGADRRSLSPATKLKVYITLTALLGGASGLLLWHNRIQLLHPRGGQGWTILNWIIGLLGGRTE
ncbi:mitochondrial Rho 1 [Flagelloscypha sp. PMI_526]|nr:mitochondrial Rho 1 [Flagelloscypha sp. PMI_526]